MKKFILTEDDKKTILGMYGLINEQNNLTVSGQYIASNCDELHAFQGTGGKDIGNMNVLVLDKIKEWNSKGINVKPTNVQVSVNGMKVNWTVTFEKSNENWIGFTSRGAGCDNDIEGRAGNDNINNGPENIKSKLKEKGKVVGKIEEINSYKYNGGGNSFKQIFYRYTLLDNINTNKTSETPKKEKVRTNTNQSQQSSPKKVVYSHTMNFSSLENLISVIKNDDYELLDKTFDVNEKPIVVIKDDKYRISFPKGTDKLTSLRLALNISSDYKNNKFPSKESLEGQGYKVWDEGTLQLQGEGVRNWALMYKKESENDSTSEIKFDNKSNKEKPSKTNTEPQDSKNIKPF
jgi:hypothetical protein